MAQVMTTKELADYLKLHEITIGKYAAKGEIPAIRIGRVWRFDKEAIDKWITGELQKPQPARQTKAKVQRQPTKKRVTQREKKVTSSDSVLTIINKSRSKKGVDTATLKNKTGFDEKKIWNIINALKRQGKIMSAGRGFYIKT